MPDKKVWFITGTSRGMGVDFAKAPLAAGPVTYLANALETVFIRTL